MDIVNPAGVIMMLLVWGLVFFLLVAAISYGINRSKLVQKLDELQNEVRQLRSEIQQAKHRDE
ncbi:hypothetical protein M3650_28555 [Paenibacillus sp. MER TA 81-3]|uniref:hypothetical protein n=1 Tax=Paenibacillus sp. MER TA 81-3 TaxID=2939573 RepID=UPI00203BBD03|nr:hypothetical protein [Paenibacillus sp. MER TA 81-3]MCM3342469.1 hypothetical protein [Paenibacillus sp. MER TA 81-3]